jgi:hypothetical protein
MRGMFHGVNQSPKQKYLADIALETPSSALIGQFKLLDYVLYYPFVDLSNLDYQEMDNTVESGAAQLSRYTDGEGIMVMYVSVGATVGGGTFTFDYINSDGNTRTSPVLNCSTASVGVSSLITGHAAVAGAYGPFLPLTNACRGVRKILGYQQIVPDGGLGCLVMVKPLFDIAIREINTTSEAVCIAPGCSPPEIKDGAYLNLIANSAASITGSTLTGTAHILWN